MSEQTCETCGGDGTVEVDRADRRGEHYTEEVDCSACGGEGTVDIDDAELRAEVADQQAGDAEVAWESPS
jgi:DnaJ-class molecular chaperone